MFCVKADAAVAANVSWMGAFMFTCPATRLKVHSWADEDEPSEDHFAPVDCPACGQIHYVVPATGKVMGEREE